MNDLNTAQGVHISFEFFLDLRCNAIIDMVQNSGNITATYESLLLQIGDIGSSLWNKSRDGGCFEGLCQSIFGGGNPDITGAGVVTAYVMEFFFAAFLPTLLLICWQRTGEREISHMHGKTEAVIESVNIFIDCSLFFALATALATCALTTHLDDVSQYDALQSILSSTLTIAPCLAPLFALQCCGEKVGRRISILGLACLVNIAVINIPNVVWLVKNRGPEGSFGFPNIQLNTLASMNATETYGNRIAAGGGMRFGDYFWEACYDLPTSTEKNLLIRISYYYLKVPFPFTMICQLLLLGLITLFGLNMAKLRFVALVRNVRKFWRTGSSFFPPTAKRAARRVLQRRNGYLPNRLEIFAFMILPLAIWMSAGYAFLGQRFLLTRAWKVKDETEWKFGQMVALLMFLPVIIEFPYRCLSNRPSKRKREADRDGRLSQLQGRHIDPSEVGEDNSLDAGDSYGATDWRGRRDGNSYEGAAAWRNYECVGGYKHNRPCEISYPGRVLTSPIPAAATESLEFPCASAPSRR